MTRRSTNGTNGTDRSQERNREAPAGGGRMRSRFPALALASALGGMLLFSTPEAHAGTVVTLTFDDNHANQYQVRQMLLDRGMRATFFILSPRIDRAGYMTLAQLHDLQNDGNEIGGHTLDHVDLTTLSAAEAERQVCEDRAALIGFGFNPTSFAYPFGAHNASVQSIVAGCGYESARGVGGVGGCASCPSAETLPPANPYATRTRSSVKVDTTLAMLQSYVTAAETAGGGWVQLVFHHICDGASCPTLSVTPSNLAAFLDWLAPRASMGTVVRTVREALNPTAPPPPPPPVDTVPPVTVMDCSPRGCSEWSNGPVTVTLAATDDGSGVAEIRYTTDGSEPSATQGSACPGDSCSFTLAASATVKFRAFDLAGNIEATQSQTIRIDTEPPEVAISSPSNLALVAGTVTVRATATDNAGIAEVRFYASGRLIGTSTSAPYQVEWDTRRDGIGLHQLHAEATDVASNTTRSASVSVLVSGL